MSDKRYEANIIRATAVEPANNLETTSAPGVWSIDEVVELQKKEKWPTVGNVATDVTDVFSTFLYDGNSGTQVIENGIALGNAYDGGSGNFTASSTTRINVTASSNFGFGTGDFTIEFFVYLNSQYNYSEFYDHRTSSQDSSTLSPIVYGDSSGRVYFYANGNLIQSNTDATPVGAWTHVAVTKASGSTKLFINGTQQGSTYSDSNNYVTPASDFSFGGSLEQDTYNVDGFMSNLRVVKGTAVYTSNFTAPTAALTAVSGTSLLTLQGSTPFVDNSGNSVVLTENGSPVASDFGPFTGTSGKGGLVWIKSRTNPGSGHFHHLVDSVRGQSSGFFKALYTNSNDPENQYPSSTNGGVSSFNSNGFTVAKGSNSNYFLNLTNYGYAAYTFRKQANFFDVIQYTGTGPGSGANEQAVSHNLGTKPGLIMIKKTSGTGDWWMFTDVIDGTNDYVYLNSTNAWNNATSNNVPTDSAFNVGGVLNTSGQTYIAYLWANHSNNGEFGPDGDADIIKMGTYNGDGQSAGVAVDLGFEPQWIFLRRTDSGGYYTQIIDNVRDMLVGSNDKVFFPNVSNAENSTLNSVEPTATGFKATDTGNSNVNGSTWFYMAIRRGPLATPTSAIDVFSTELQNAGGAYTKTTNFITDLIIQTDRSGTAGVHRPYDRLRGGAKYLETAGTAAEASGGTMEFDNNTGYTGSTSLNTVDWVWKRAPGYFDVTTWTGTGSAITINHNLGAVPKMIWVKRRDSAQDWIVYHSGNDVDGDSQPWTDYLRLDSNQAGADADYFNDTAPTSTTFQVKGYGPTGASGGNFIAYLFGEVAGVSKLGSFVADGNAQNIDCGFSSGARYILIKKSSGTSDWYVWDSARGIVAGNDPYLALNTTAAEQTSGDWVDPHSSGFSITSAFSNGTYIFYAVA